MVMQAITEAVAVAHARGVPLPDSTAAEYVQFIDNATPNLKSSMLVDLENGRRLELEMLNGAVSRMGKESAVPTPVNDFIYACLKPYVNGRPEAQG
jgi:2-dehydropantoate 2-reductase